MNTICKASRWLKTGFANRSRVNERFSIPKRDSILRLEELEERIVPAAGYTPQQVDGAYGVNQITFIGGVAGNGAGQTIVIADAYDDPYALSDLETFDQIEGLPNPPSFQKLNQYGQAFNYPPTDPTAPKSNSWEVEESIDIEWAHAIAPDANIILVEANNADNLYAAAAEAGTLGSVVSLSWGKAGGFSGETNYDAQFNVTGVTFLAATGDTGYPGNYPAESPYVVAVGGTTLNVGPGASFGGEVAWNGSGGGLSNYESRPAFQDNEAGVVGGQRGTPDVSAIANNNQGVQVYDSFDKAAYGGNPLFEQGGTSLATPIWAGLIAIADQGRASQGLAPLSSSQTLDRLYNVVPYGDFNDITSGYNGGYNAGPGYDLATGLGSPNAALLVNDLAGVANAAGRGGQQSQYAYPAYDYAYNTYYWAYNSYVSDGGSYTAYVYAYDSYIYAYDAYYYSAAGYIANAAYYGYYAYVYGYDAYYYAYSDYANSGAQSIYSYDAYYYGYYDWVYSYYTAIGD